MRGVRRDFITIYYALYTGETDKTVDGLYTGEKVKSYTEPIEMKINASAARGNTVVELFGVDVPYDKTLVTHDLNCPIDENSVLWIDRTPEEGEFDYIVQRRGRGLNNITYAVRKVSAS